ncbi:hypothetical protein TNCV_4138751 [Trichonephila clavipes]|nr:hypothetical protein TNCV_4138751 [Trichonephila clavipes]
MLRFWMTAVSVLGPDISDVRDTPTNRIAGGESNQNICILQRLPGLESLREKKGVLSYEDLLTINELNTPLSRKLQEKEERAAGLSKSEEFIKEVLDDGTSVMNSTEEEPH